MTADDAPGVPSSIAFVISCVRGKMTFTCTQICTGRYTSAAAAHAIAAERACARRLYSIQPTMISVIENASIAKPVR